MKKWDWRSNLTAKERAIVEAQDADMAEYRRALKSINAVRKPIVNRALQRAKYLAGAR